MRFQANLNYQVPILMLPKQIVIYNFPKMIKVRMKANIIYLK